VRQLPAEISVLESVAAPGQTTKFIDQVVRYAPGGVKFVYFSWRTALLGKFDVFHVHWPEYLVRHSRVIPRTVKRLLFCLLLWRLRRRQIPVVRTVHNLEPHTAGSMSERRQLQKLDSLVGTHVVLNTCTPVDWQGVTEVIRHGDYREVLGHFEKARARRSRIVYFGRIEAYKGVLELLRLASAPELHDLEVRIVGNPARGMRELVARELTQLDPAGAQVSARLEFVPDVEMVREITSGEMVVLPYREMHNSGVLLVALSLGRPVMVPRSCVASEISAEVGPGWILEYDGELSTAKLREALEASRVGRSAVPKLEARSWERIANEYASVFERAEPARFSPRRSQSA
jgi:beta-1,4-mannosyltransferase